MKEVRSHAWALAEPEAMRLQLELAALVERDDRLSDHLTRIAGVDVAYDQASDRLVAAVVVLDAMSLAVVEQATAEDVARFAYVPGLFSFRELPPIAAALGKLQLTPDLIVCDGQGIAHPRRFGLACHLGVLFDVPTIGCAKKLLIGRHDELGSARGDQSSLSDGGEVIGSALRTQDGTNPVYVSIGHRISLATVCSWVLRLASTYRLPETTRRADQLVRRALETRGVES
jgi:deoxyribonuclease V